MSIGDSLVFMKYIKLLRQIGDGYTCMYYKCGYFCMWEFSRFWYWN